MTHGKDTEFEIYELTLENRHQLRQFMTELLATDVITASNLELPSKNENLWELAIKGGWNLADSANKSKIGI